MFGKLRLKFMALSSMVLVLVICVVMLLVYWMALATMARQTRTVIELILDNGGSIPEIYDFDMDDQPSFLALNAEALHEARFFSAEISGGEVSIVEMRVAAVSESRALELAGMVFSRKRDSGQITVTDYMEMRYGRRTNADGGGLVVFLDISSRFGTLRVVMMYMALLWFTVLVFYIIIMGHYSGKLIQPFIENDERQKRFITNASHELKTPLAVISANTEMTEVTGGKSKWTESTRRQTAKMQELIEELVVLTRLDEMKESDLTDVDFSDIVRSGCENFRGLIESSGRSFSSDVQDGVVVRGDKRGLAQIVSVLLDNAAKYCDEGGSVSAVLSGKARSASLVVSNTYKDGKNADFQRFFERFYRQDESHNSAKSGFGIGLSMAKEIAQHMKGKLRVSYKDDTVSFHFEI